MGSGKHSVADKLLLFIAQGFGTGRIPIAPGTFGTLVGFGWIYLLLIPESLWLYIGGTFIGVLAAIFVGSRAEELLHEKDPGSIVIDEIVALPIAFLAPVLLFSVRGATPASSYYLGREHALTLFLTFALFRLFDVTKPFGINRIQKLPGGWGLVLDDVLAAMVVAICLWLFLASAY
jgi:phosphatidylglycerophosphatase A